MLRMLALSLAKRPGYPLPDLMWLRRRELGANDAGLDSWFVIDRYRFPNA
jgi:hypothetical protein